VGWSDSANGFEAFLWDQAHGVRCLFDVLTTDYDLGSSLTGWRLTRATAISPDGQAIVGYGFNPNGQAEAWLVRLQPVPLPAAGYLFGFPSGGACRLCPTEPRLTRTPRPSLSRACPNGSAVSIMPVL
jgi:hypothetical protein